MNEFPKFDSKDWHVYKNALEDKKTINSWYMMPKNTYTLFQYFNSNEFVSLLSRELSISLYPDSGLHGGGWHCHGDGEALISFRLFNPSKNTNGKIPKSHHLCRS